MEKKKPSEVSTTLSLSCSSDSQTSTCSSKSQPSNASASSSNNRKRRSKCEKRVCHNIPKERKRARSIILNHYELEDPWKIKKTLKQSDLGDMSRLLMPTNLVEDLVLPVMGVDAKDPILTNEGFPIEFWDVNTMSLHKLLLKRWSSSKSYVFIGSWNQDFVKRRNLKKGDEIGLQWDSNKTRFDFAVLHRDFFQQS